MSDQTGARDILDEIRALNEERQAELAQLLQPHIQGGLGRRELLQGAGTLGVAGLLGAGGGAAVGTARADASDSDGDGDVGEPGNPVDAWFDGISADGSIITVDDGGWALAHSTPTSATTSSGEQFVFADTTIAAFPYTLATADLVPGHAKRIHCNGGNTLTVNTQGSATIDGQPSLELEDGQQVIVYTDGSNWFTNLAFPAIATGSIGNAGSPIQQNDPFETDQLPDGTTVVLRRYTTSGGGVIGWEGAQRTLSVGTTLTPIFDRTAVGANMTMLNGFVFGRKVSGGLEWFIDEILGVHNTTITVGDSAERGTPDARTYDWGSELELSMATDSFDIFAKFEGGNF